MYIYKEKDIHNSIDVEIKHFMSDRATYKAKVSIKASVHNILDEFWKANEKLKASYGTKALYCTVVSSIGQAH